MPRGPTGIYTLPIGAFSPGGLIKADDHNQNYEDIATALTQSLATNVSTPLTAPLFASQGSVAKPGITFAGDTGTGFYKSGLKQIGWSYGGVQGGVFNNDAAGGVLFNGAITAPSLATSAAVAVGTALTVGTTAQVTGKLSLLSTDSVALPNGTTAQRNGSPSIGDFRYNSDLNVVEYRSNTTWVQLGAAGASPTVQTFRTAGAATYTPPAGIVRIRVRMIGGGGGGGATNTNAGATGGTTSFGTWTAIGGQGGTGGVAANPAFGGTGGTGGANGTGTLIIRTNGANGGTGNVDSGGGKQGAGAGSPFGTGAFGVGCATLFAGQNAGAVPGTGGAGGGTNNTGAGGGGAGEYLEFYMTAAQIGVSLAFTVGALGTGGPAGTAVGGNGAPGVIIVEEFYS